MSGLLDKIKSELFSEGPTSSVQTVEPQVATTPPETVSAVPQPSPSTPSVIDPDVLKLIRDSVLVDTIDGRPSAYMKFFKVWEAMRHPVDTSVVIAVLQVTDPSITEQTIAYDLAAHISLLETTTEDAENEISVASQESSNSFGNKITDLRKKKEEATVRVTELMKTMEDFDTQISSLQNNQAEMKDKLESASQKSRAAIGAVRSELNLLASRFNIKG